MEILPISVSVIVPVYNGERYLSACLDSLIRQTLHAIEIIVVDDCSTDKTPNILQEYAKKDERIHVIRNETNLRQGLSRNKALATARGEYVGFVDSDDWVDASYFEQLYLAATREHASIAKAEALWVHRNGSIVKKFSLNEAISNGIKRGEPLPVLFTCEFWTAIYLRSDLIKQEITFPNLSNAQDLVFLFRATSRLSGFAAVPDVFYYYRQHDNSTTALRTKEYYDNILQAGEYMLTFISSAPNSPRNKGLLAIYVIRVLAGYMTELNQRPDFSAYAGAYRKKCLELLIHSDIPGSKIVGFLPKGLSPWYFELALQVYRLLFVSFYAFQKGNRAIRGRRRAKRMIAKFGFDKN